MNKAFIKLLWLSLFLVVGDKALAYVPPAEFLLEKMVEKRSKMGYSRLRIAMRCTDGDSKSYNRLLYLKAPGMVRWEKDGEEVDICRKGACFRKLSTGQTTRLPDWAYLPFLYFAESRFSTSSYLRLLQSLGVKTEIDTIDRFYGNLAFVLGAKHWERDRPQFWLDKDRALPLRLMVRDGNSIVDIKWVGWGSREGGNWFPEKLEITRDGKILQQCEIEQIGSSVPVPDSLFQI